MCCFFESKYLFLMAYAKISVGSYVLRRGVRQEVAIARDSRERSGPISRGCVSFHVQELTKMEVSNVVFVIINVGRLS